MERLLLDFLDGLLAQLNGRLDRRPVSTFFGSLIAILCHRYRNHGLLLSELGAFLLGPERCRAGTKRLSNLLQSNRWNARLIGQFLWRQGSRRVAELQAEGESPLVVWDESVLEKPESLAAERLCAVRSSKAVRLKRIKPGYWLLHTFCHRNGKRSRVTPAPLYRLRIAIRHFWPRHPPPFLSFL